MRAARHALLICMVLALAAKSTYLHDDTQLLPGSWFVDRLYFHLPDAESALRARLELVFVRSVDAGGEDDLISVAFRIEEEPGLHGQAFVRARKARKKEDRIAKKEARRAARSERRGLR